MQAEKTVHIETDDKMMNFENNGQLYRTNDHVTEVPESFARQLKKVDVPGVRQHKQVFSLSHVSDEQWRRAFGRK